MSLQSFFHFAKHMNAECSSCDTLYLQGPNNCKQMCPLPVPTDPEAPFAQRETADAGVLVKEEVQMESDDVCSVNDQSLYTHRRCLNADCLATLEPVAQQLGPIIMAAAERFCTPSLSRGSKRFLFEFLAMLDANDLDVLGITKRWMGFHVIKHFCRMRHIYESTGVVLGFLQFLRSEVGALPDFSANLNAAIKVAHEACEQLPAIMRIIRQPDVLNEAYAFRYSGRPWPLSHVPQTTEVKDSSSRAWPANNEQQVKAWVSFTSERCRVEPHDLQELLDTIPATLSIVSKVEGRWEVQEISADSRIRFRDSKGHTEYKVQFSARRAADFAPGMLMCATFVTLNDGVTFVADWGYVFPSFYAPDVNEH